MLSEQALTRLGLSGAVLYHAPRTPPGAWFGAHEEGRVPDGSIGGRALVTRRAVIDIVRRVTLGSYGVAGFAGSWADRVLGWIEQRPGGLRVSVAGGTLTIRLHLRVAHGLPVAEVARQVDKLTIRVARLEIHPGGEPPQPPARPGLGPSDLADSGTDIF